MTLVDALALTLALGLLYGVALPWLRGASSKTPAVRCLNSQKQLAMAWLTYAHDYDGAFAPNYHGGAALGSSTLGPGFARGWLDWTTSADNTNVALLTDSKHSALAVYLDRKSEVFKCPSDRYLAPVQRSRGWKMRVRSVSQNLAVGPGNALTGPWDVLYKQVVKMSDFNIPSPAESYVFLDEHADSINDPGFYSPYRTQVVDVPAAYHQNAGGFSFADGHAEMHRWRGAMSNTNAPVRFTSFLLRQQPRAGDPDIAWLSYHTPRVRTNYYN